MFKAAFVEWLGEQGEVDAIRDPLSRPTHDITGLGQPCQLYEGPSVFLSPALPSSLDCPSMDLSLVGLMYGSPEIEFLITNRFGLGTLRHALEWLNIVIVPLLTIFFYYKTTIVAKKLHARICDKARWWSSYKLALHSNSNKLSWA